MKTLKRMMIVFVAGLLLSQVAVANTLTGRVVWVADGDSLTVTTGHVMQRNLEQHRIRLSEIDAPEKGQAYGRDALKALRAMTLGRTVEIFIEGKDQYGRLVGRVTANRHGEFIDVNAELVRLGLAWTSPPHVQDTLLIRLEEEAQKAKRGLWAQPESERIAPWDWRKSR